MGGAYCGRPGGTLAASSPLDGGDRAVPGAFTRLGQHLVSEALAAPGQEQRLVALAGLYRARRDTFAEQLSRHFGALADWSVPEGGLFFWLALRLGIDTRALLPEAIARGVAFMPGEEFYPGTLWLGTMRLNFSHAAPEDAERGLAALAALVRAAM